MTWYGVARAIVLPLCRLLFRVKVYGLEHVPASGVFILAPSHRSILDIPFAAFSTKRRIRFMAKREIFTTRIGRATFNALGAIEVDRGATDRGALRASKAALVAGEPLGIFPEGTRCEGPEISELYDGCAYLALKLGVPIVPVGIGGSQEIMPPGRVIPRLHRVVVVVGEPIEVATDTKTHRRSAVTNLSDELYARLQGCFDHARELSGSRASPPGRPANTSDSHVVAERGEHG